MGPKEGDLDLEFELQIELKKVWWKPIIFFNHHEKMRKRCRVVDRIHVLFASLTAFFSSIVHLSDHPYCHVSSATPPPLLFISSLRNPAPGLKESTRKDPWARPVSSRECIQCVAPFCSARYYIYLTPNGLWCRSQFSKHAAKPY